MDGCVYMCVHICVCVCIYMQIYIDFFKFSFLGHVECDRVEMSEEEE